MAKTYYGINVLYFEFFGFWQYLNGGIGANKRVISSLAYAVLFVAFIVMQVYDMFANDYDFSIFTEKLSVNLTCLESVIKMSFYCFKRTNLQELLDLFRLDLLLSSKHAPQESDKILQNNLKTVNGSIKSFVVMIFTTVGLWNSLPLLKCYTSDGCEKLQIMPSWYPGEVTTFPMNLIVYIFEFGIMTFCAALLYNVNCIFLALAVTAAAQFELLSSNIKDLQVNVEKITKYEATADKKEAMNKLLRECLVDHQILLRLLRLMEDVFNPIFLFQMLTSTFTICLVLFQLNFHLASGEDLPIAMACKFIMYLVFGSMELFVYSWGGQIIYNKSEEIYWSLQVCGWHEGCNKFKTNVRIALQRSQFPVKLTAGKFYVVNLASFSQVIKASYSYFTFLHGSISKK